MRRRIGIGIAVLVVTLVGLVPWAQAQSSPSSTASAQGQKVVLQVGETADLDTDNPFAVSGGSDWTVVTSQYDMLLKFSDGDLSPAPSLATGCDHSADYLTWTCTLRPGLRWSDGTPLTSEDVAFSYRFVIKHQIPQYISYFPFQPGLHHAERHHAGLDRGEADVRAEHAAVGLHRARARVVEVRRRRPEDDQDGSEHPQHRERPVHPDVVDPRPGLDDGPQPVLLGPAADDRPGAVPALHEPGVDDPGAEERRDRLRRRPEALADRLHQGRSDDHAAAGRLRLVAQLRVQLRRARSQQSHPLPALQNLTVRKAIEMAIDKKAIVDEGLQRHRHAGGYRASGRRRRTGTSTSRPTRSSRSTRRRRARCWTRPATSIPNGDGIREDPKTGQPLVLNVPASQDTAGAVEAGQLIVGFLKDIGIGSEPPAGERREDERLSGPRGTSTPTSGTGAATPTRTTSCPCSPRASAAAGATAAGRIRDYDAIYEEAAGHHGPRRSASWSCRRRSATCTTTSPASCSRTRDGSRRTATTGSRGGCRLRARTAICSPGTTTTHSSPCTWLPGRVRPALHRGCPPGCGSGLIVAVVAVAVVLFRRRRGVDEEA